MPSNRHAIRLKCLLLDEPVAMVEDHQLRVLQPAHHVHVKLISLTGADRRQVVHGHHDELGKCGAFRGGAHGIVQLFLGRPVISPKLNSCVPANLPRQIKQRGDDANGADELADVSKVFKHIPLRLVVKRAAIFSDLAGSGKAPPPSVRPASGFRIGPCRRMGCGQEVETDVNVENSTALDLAAAKDAVADMPLDEIDVSQPELFQNDTVGLYFDRLRDECPVHHCRSSRFGEFWSITRFDDIMAVDKDHRRFSSERGGIQIVDFPEGMERVNFINMDPPQHDEKRKVVSPIVAPSNLANLQHTIRERVIDILENLPRGEEFDWVDRVSIELTTRMLATLFDFPYADRRKLTWWSEVATVDLASGGVIDTEEKRLAELQTCLETFTGLMRERANLPPRSDLISMMAHSDMVNMSPKEFLGTLILLIVGGNDTTRNSISGGLLALNENPGEMRKLRRNPNLVASLVPEIIRWQTPLTSMRRTTTQDVQLGAQQIPAGAKVMM